MSAVKLKDIFEEGEDTLGITHMTGSSGLTREICHVRVQRFKEEEIFWDMLIPESILVVAPLYLSKLACDPSNEQEKFLRHIVSAGVSCVALSESAVVPELMRALSECYRIPIFASPYDEYLLESRLLGLLREKIEHIISLHGALVNVFGYGIVIMGESGIGKTECACSLTERGHAWIADDAVELERKDSLLYGRSQGLVKHLVNIKSIGIIDAKIHLGRASVRDETVIDLMIEFQKTSHARGKGNNHPAKHYRRIMGITVPYFCLQVFPWSMNIHTHVENIARSLIQ